MTDPVEHYRRVWDKLVDDFAVVTQEDKGLRSRALVTGFVLHGVLDGRAPLNVLTQWEIDPESIIEQSLAELRGFKACLPDFMAAQQGAPEKVRDAFGALADYFTEIADHAEARCGLRALWREVIPQITAEVGR